MKKFISIMMSLCMVMSMFASVLAADAYIGENVTAIDGVLTGIVSTVRAIGFAFAAGMLLYVGIKYVMASANEKADLKKGSISYVIGAVIIFGASALLGIFDTLGDQVITAS